MSLIWMSCHQRLEERTAAGRITVLNLFTGAWLLKWLVNVHMASKTWLNLMLGTLKWTEHILSIFVSSSTFNCADQMGGAAIVQASLVEEDMMPPQFCTSALPLSSPDLRTRGMWRRRSRSQLHLRHRRITLPFQGVGAGASRLLGAADGGARSFSARCAVTGETNGQEEADQQIDGWSWWTVLWPITSRRTPRRLEYVRL